MAEQIVYEKSSLIQVPNITGCPGCFYGLIASAFADACTELGLDHKKAVTLTGAGCSGGPTSMRFNMNRMNCPHGRPAASATGIKRARPDIFVSTWQGDGDLAGIGMGETIHAANRGECITVFFQNNQVYANTGGQMAPTTLEGQVTTTSPYGRDVNLCGYPISMCEIINQLEAPKYIARVTFTDTKNILFARKCIKKAVQCQMEGIGYAFVETICPCPTNWHMSMDKAIEHINNEVVKKFPIGEIRTF
jgi:2-oxoglutarate ferredoxin oxidoreductase subunit beta